MSSTLTIFVLFLTAISLVSGCSTSGDKDRIGFEEARKMFASRGVQPGQPLPALSVVDMQGTPASIPGLQGGRPLVLVTASITCNVARRQQPQVDALRDRFGDEIAVIVLYTIDAHPKGDACPYTGKEWVPPANEKDQVLVRQPTDLPQRLAAARDYQSRFSSGATVVVDDMDNASWKALGEAPNLGLLIDRAGVVRVRQGWFDSKEMEASVQAMLASN